MARDTTKYVKLYSPYGSEVEVNEERGEVLKDRGYTTSKPRNLGKRAKGNDDSARVAELEAQLAKANEDLAAATAPPAQS